MRFVIVCPHDGRTGGPEALHQLSDTAISLGFNAEMWYYTQNDIHNLSSMLARGQRLVAQSFSVPERHSDVDEYSRYKTRPFTNFEQGDLSTVFVLPENLAWILPLFSGSKILFWWLSVDNAFSALGRVNLNLLRMPWVKHAAQSDYALSFLRPLGIHANMLTDYTPLSISETVPVEMRGMRIAINAGPKVIFNIEQIVKAIEQYVNDLDVIKIAGLTRQEVFDAFASSRVFLDLGNLPGCDRMAREAFLLGALPVITNSGAGLNSVDFNFPEIYKPAPYYSKYLAKIVSQVMISPNLHFDSFREFGKKIKSERANFGVEVLECLSEFYK